MSESKPREFWINRYIATKLDENANVLELIAYNKPDVAPTEHTIHVIEYSAFLKQGQALLKCNLTFQELLKHADEMATMLDASGFKNYCVEDYRDFKKKMEIEST